MNVGGHNNAAPASDLLRNVSGNNTFNGAFTIAAGGGGYGVDSADVNGTMTLGGPIKNTVAASTRAPTFIGAGNGVVSGLISDGNTASSILTAAVYSGTGTWTIPQTANTYTGSTSINAGVVEVAALAGGGASSSIGASSSAAGTWLAGGGTLRYIGAAAASTDRLFTQTTGTTFTLDTSAAAGALTFSNTGAVVYSGTAAAQTLVLSGNNAGVNRFAPSIGNGNAGAAVTSLTKSGSDTWAISGASTYTGVTTVNGGTLQLDFSAANAPASNIINNTANSSALTMAGGTLALIGKASTTNSQQFNGLTINQGGSKISLAADVTANPLSLNIGAITRNTGGTMDFALPAGAQASTNGVLTPSPANAAGILGGWATVNNGADWATTDGTNVQPYTGYTTLTTAGGGTAGATNFNASGSIALSAPVTANSLRIASTADGQSLDLAGNNITLTGTTGGLLYAGGGTANAHSIVATGGGTLSAGSDEFVLNTAAGSTLTMSAVITGTAASGSPALTKAGAGTLVLATPNTYTGDTVVAGGTLVATDANAVPNGTGKGNVIVASGGTLAVSGSTNINGLTGVGAVQSAGGAATLVFGNGDVGTTFAGTLRDGAGTLGLSKVGNGTMILSGSNSFTGPVSVTTGSTGGALQVTSSTALGNSSGVTLSNSTLAGGGGSTLQLSGNITISGVTLNAVTSNSGGSRRTTLSAVSGSPTWAGSIVLSGNDLAQFTTAASTVLTLAGPVTGPSFAGTFFIRGAAGTGNVTGLITRPATAAVAKTDLGTWIISRSGNTWGNTSVAVGTLQMAAASALPATTALTMGQGDTNSATLDLNGFDQTVVSLTLNSGATGNKTITSTGTIRATLTVNNSSASTWGNATSTTNLLAGNLGLTKTGSATLTLSGTGTNTYTGATTITAGTLSLGTANRIPATSQVILGGGTLATNGLNDSAGALTVTANSIVDLGNGASVLQFANSSGETWTGGLTINNWSGDPSAGGGTDQVFVGNSAFTLTSAQLSQITFTGFGTGAKLLSNGEVVPVPEPTTAAVVGLGVCGLLLRRRRRTSQNVT
jgi:autotransporter-associated beta strand protein